jgi:hypothetical protein
VDSLAEEDMLDEMVDSDELLDELDEWDGEQPVLPVNQ